MPWLAILATTALALAAMAPNDELDAVLSQMTRSYQALDTLTARITQTKTYTALGIADPPESGTLEIRLTDKATNMRLEFTAPEIRILTIKDGRYVLFQPRIRQAVVGDTSSATSSSTGGFLKYLLGDLDGAQDDFEIALVESNDETTHHLRLTPRRPDEMHYRRIDLWVDETTGIPAAEELIETNGDIVRIVLEDIRLNEKIPDSRFLLELPDDVERVPG